ncbi:hypothetical protein J5T34_21780 [Cupriavidus gilardii]|nr:hypothetical protein [Cupriavidus gilardii]MBO4123365.1 hypothetical protein [Cupriavidus gilardii]
MRPLLRLGFVVRLAAIAQHRSIATIAIIATIATIATTAQHRPRSAST